MELLVEIQMAVTCVCACEDMKERTVQSILMTALHVSIYIFKLNIHLDAFEVDKNIKF